MLDIEEILATERMFDQNKLDVRTITMGISLLGCVSDDEKTLLTRIYDTICQKAEHLTEVSHDISREYGVPIINRRISVTPVALIAGGTNAKSYVPIAETLQKAADVVGVDILGGFSALVDRGMSSSDKILIDSIPEVLAVTKSICSSVAIGSTKAGINMDAVKRMGEIVKETAEITKDQDAYGCTKLVEFCNAVEDNPFMAGAFHGVTQGDTAIHVGVSGPGVVKRALEDVKGAPLNVVAKTIKNTAFMITRLGQMVAEAAVDRLHAPFGIIDLSLAPTSAVGDSVAQVLEEMGLESCGGPGTTAALALLNDAVKKGGLMTSRRLVRRKAVTGAVTGRSAPIRPNVSPLSAGLPALPEPSSSPSTCCLLFWGAFGQPVRGPWPFRKPPMASSTASACATACPWPMTYRRLCRRLMGRSSAGSRMGQTRWNGSLPGRAKPCAA